MANLITIARFPLLLIIVLLLYADSVGARFAATFLVPLLIFMDTLDGMIARRRHEVSLLGSVLDIMADRSVELVLWVCYAHLGLIPIAIPLIVILRGTIVDSLRSIHVREGEAPFHAMRTRLGSWLVSSPWMRSSYGISKLLAFTGLGAAHAVTLLAEAGQASMQVARGLTLAFNIMSWVAVAFCLVRGLPVIIEALPLLRKGQAS